MKDTQRVKYAVYIASTVWSLVLFLAGVQLPGLGAKAITFLPLLVVLLFAVFDNWLWRVGPMKQLVGRPNVIGTWKGDLVSFRADTDGQEVQHAPTPIYLVIRQTFLEVSVTLLSAESKSRTIMALLQTNHSDEYTIYYHYSNTPELAVRHRSPEHVGGAKIEVGGLLPSSLVGEYWTNRRSRGTFTVRRASDKVFGSYVEAAAELGGGDNQR